MESLFTTSATSLIPSFIQLTNVGSGPTIFKAPKQARIHGTQILSQPNFTLTEQKKLEYRVEGTLRTTDKVSVAINPKEK